MRPEPEAQPQPSTVWEFTKPIVVAEAHVGGPGAHVHNIVYLQWVEEVAAAHWRSAKSGRDPVDVDWFVVRHEIDYLREAFVGDTLIASTRIERWGGARLNRLVEFSLDGVVIARARTTWAAISRQTGRPTRITAAMMAGLEHIRHKRGNPEPDDGV